MSKPTISDIAREAGISKAAASYALSRRRDKVSHDLVVRVAAIAERLGWRPNTAARSLRSGSFQRVALVVEDRFRFEHVPPLLLAGMLETLTRQHYDLVLMAAPEVGPRAWAPQLAQESSVDAIALLWDRPVLPVWYDDIAASGVPVLTINQGAPCDDVSIDEHAGAAALGRVLAAAGHRRIGWSAFWQRQLGAGHRHFSVDQRAAGLAAGAGVELIEGPALEGGGSSLAKPLPPTDDILATWRADLRRWLAGPDRPDAVVCYDPANLIEVAHAALAIDPDLAASLAYAVFDSRAVVLPGLDVLSVVLPQRDVGHCVADELLARCQSRPPVHALPRPRPRLVRGEHGVADPV